MHCSVFTFRFLSSPLLPPVYSVRKPSIERAFVTPHLPLTFRVTEHRPKERNNSEATTLSPATLEEAAPDIHHEEAFFEPRSVAQEKANEGTDEGGAAVHPEGAWVEAAKQLVPPPPPPEVN